MFTDWEIVFVDSFSEDETLEILSNFDCSQRKTILQRSRGIYECWNSCIENSRGDYIYFATSDDWMADSCLSLLHSAARKNPKADIIASLPLYIDERGIHQVQRRRMLEKILYCKRIGAGYLSPVYETLYGILSRTPIPSINQMLIKKSSFMLNGLFPTGYGNVGDYYWQMRAFKNLKIFLLPKRLAAWRRYEGQLTGANYKELAFTRAKLSSLLFANDDLVKNKMVEAAVGLVAGYYSIDILAQDRVVQRAYISGKIIRRLDRIGAILMHRYISPIIVKMLLIITKMRF